MGQFSKVESANLNAARLDAEYYGTAYVKNAERIASFGNVSTLEEMRKRSVPIRRGIDMPNFVDDATSPLMVTIAAFDDPGINFKGLQRVSKIQHLAFKGSHIKSGDLLVAMGGYAGKAAICPPDTPESNIGRHTARIVVDETKADVYYVWAFIRSAVGTLQFERYITGSVQAGINLEDIRDITIASPTGLVQKYIGDKVRQAELLRTWAKALSISIAAQFSDLVKNPLPAKVSWVAKKEDLDPYRINPKHYDPVVLDLIQRGKDECIRLDSLSALVGTRQIAGGATPKGAQYFDMGILFARVQNVKPLRLDLSDAVYIDQFADEELARSRCAADDIILTITGYPGTASLVTEEDLPVNINQHSVRFNIKEGIEPGYVCAALNSKFLKYQVDRLAIGGTRDALDYPSVGRLLIPRYEAEVEKTIAEQARCVNAAIKLSQRLTSTAKLLVEDLIEGQITEAQLIAAEQALQAGNDMLDRKILSRLKTDGIDGEGAALFSDLDELYRLLALAEVE
ncbi:hypothetical protein NUK47_14360 [Aeromonas hydrophila]|uniref:hypothetical protein n=1 Tax=Aeromonas hydrophila TaxID=644 RepID=UPI00214D8F31|nr:hypothetical protein [Aeromonas hydrophila]MCR3909954.1 hypothetical protein [Aeromonas hydrophila]